MKTSDHLELYLGPIAAGWRAQGSPGVQICLFRDRPCDGAVTYSTLGAGDHTLSVVTGRQVRQEYVLAVYERFESDNWPKLLMHVTDLILAKHIAPRRGEMLSLGYPVAARSACDTLYFSVPVVFHSGLATFELTDPATVVAWAVPITTREANFVTEAGWDAFEDELEKQDPDLLDPMRESIV